MAKVSYESTYPAFTNFVKYQIPKVATDKKKFEAFLGYADFYGRENEARLALSYGTLPWVEYKDLSYPEAGVNLGGYEHEIFINEDVVRQFDTIRIMQGAAEISRQNWDRIWEHVHLVLEALVVHEIVHWHDNKDGQKKGATRRTPSGGRIVYDAGDLFEIAAYGRKVTQDLYDGSLRGWLGWDENTKQLYEPAHKAGGV